MKDTLLLIFCGIAFLVFIAILAEDNATESIDGSVQCVPENCDDQGRCTWYQII